jgi:hypothetical protein
MAMSEPLTREEVEQVLHQRLADYEKILSGKYGDLFATAQKLQSRLQVVEGAMQTIINVIDDSHEDDLPREILVAKRHAQAALTHDSDVAGKARGGEAMSDQGKPTWEWRKECESLRTRVKELESWLEERDRAIAAQQHELTQWRDGGITEELLRKQDGFLKLGKGCCIVIEQQWNEREGKLVQLEQQKETLTRCYLSTVEMLQQADGDMHIQRATAIEAMSSKRRDVLIEISERFAAGASGLDILQWCRAQAEGKKP